MLHLSATREEALSIAQRKTDQPVVIRVLAKQAHQRGVVFYREGGVYLTKMIPSECVVSEPS